MKFKDKQKLWYSKIKELRNKDWKFNSHYIFKNFNDTFFSVSFYISLKENKISGSIGYKPMNIDNVFWDIIDEQPNKKMPLSFRGNAAFCVSKILIYRFDFEINEVNCPDKEILELLNTIEEKVNEKIKFGTTNLFFRNDMLLDEKQNTIGIITSLIEEFKFTDALKKIQEYRLKDYYSMYQFEDGDFYDLAERYIKNYC